MLVMMRLGLRFFCGKTWLRQDFARPALSNDFFQKSLAQGLHLVKVLIFKNGAITTKITTQNLKFLRCPS
jgi:hypothetical protein